MASLAEKKSRVVSFARSLGFDRIGITSADPLSESETYLAQWLSEGKSGDLGYLQRDPSRRTRPADHLAGAKSVVMLAMNYFPGDPSPGTDGRISRYAWGKDYHKLIQKRLESFVRYLEFFDTGVQCRTYVDTGPLLERPLAQRAGLGFIGKNTMLITRGLGSWVFLASVITTLELPIDAPDLRTCGTCRLCIDACPTDALHEPYELDARRCIAYLTIELDGGIPEDFRSKTAGWIFGCDVCQEVCPHNTRVPLTAAAEFSPGVPPMVRLEEILQIGTEESFRQRFGGTPLARAERHGLIRNACLAAAHFGRKDLVADLERLTNDEHPVVREHAGWALERLRAPIDRAEENLRGG